MDLDRQQLVEQHQRPTLDQLRRRYCAVWHGQRREHGLHGNAQPGNQQPSGLIFQNQAYTLSGSTLILGGTSPTIAVNASGGTIASLIAGTNLVTKTGTGSLTLTANNTSLSGGFSVNGGTLVLNSTNGNRPTGTGTLTVNGGATVDASAQANNFGNYNSGTVIPIRDQRQYDHPEAPTTT